MMTSALASFLRRFRRDRSGLSALEFALIAPAMLALYLGAVEVSLGLSIDRKITHTASALADLVAQDDVITDAEIDNIMGAARAIVAPFATDPLAVRITSVEMNDDGDAEVQWSDAMGALSPFGQGGGVAMPDGVLRENRTVIMVEVEYDYSTLFNELGMDSIEIREVFYLRPRMSLAVSRS